MLGTKAAIFHCLFECIVKVRATAGSHVCLCIHNVTTTINYNRVSPRKFLKWEGRGEAIKDFRNVWGQAQHTVYISLLMIIVPLHMYISFESSRGRQVDLKRRGGGGPPYSK